MLCTLSVLHEMRVTSRQLFLFLSLFFLLFVELMQKMLTSIQLSLHSLSRGDEAREDSK